MHLQNPNFGVRFNFFRGVYISSICAYIMRLSFRAYLFAIPNGGSRHKLEAKKLKAEGVRAGVPDLQLVVPRNGLHGLFVEMKRRNGVPSDIKQEQKDWHYKLRQKGYAVTVAFGYEMAKQAITDYLNGIEIKDIYRNT